MARDNVTFRFNIDLTQMTVKGQQAVKILQDLERTSGRAAGGMDRLGTSSAKAGQQSAASAVNFQTATQGMLNLSTAAVQTYTSISNLDRANNRAKMSIIAVARAEDLLNNKKTRLIDLQNKGVTSGNKFANMQREIATATADLTVKQEKQKIEQAAVNDIYMLFATNIANVTISSMQTIAILDKNGILISKGKVIAQKLVNFATWDNIRATRTQTVATRMQYQSTAISSFGFKGQAFAIKGATFAQRMNTVATRAGTMALHGLKIALGPIGLILIGISAAMLAYENNIGGVKDTIQQLLGVEDDHLKLMEEERLATEGLTDANNDLATSYKKLPAAMENYLKLHEVAAIQNGNLAAQIAITKQRMGFSSGVGSTQNIGGSGTGGGFGNGSGGSGSGGSGSSGQGSGGGVSSTPPALESTKTGFIIADKLDKIDPVTGEVLPWNKVSTSSMSKDFKEEKPQSVLDYHKSTAAEAITKVADPFGSFQEKANFGAMNVRDQAITLSDLASKSMDNGEEFRANSYGKWLASISDAAVNYVDPEKGKHIGFADLKHDNSGLNSLREQSTDQFSGGNLIRGSSEFIDKGNRGSDGLAWFLPRYENGNFYRYSGPEKSRRVFYAGSGGKQMASSYLKGATFGSGGGYNADGSRGTEGSGIEKLRQIQMDSYGVNAFKKTRNNLSQHTELQMDLINTRMNSSSEHIGYTQSQIDGDVSASGLRGFTSKFKMSRNRATLSNFRNRVARGDSFVNGLGGMMLNVINMLKGGRAIISRGHQDVAGRGGRVAGADVISKAVQYGIKGMPEWMDMIKQIPAVNKESDKNMDQARESLSMAVSIASQYVGMVDNAKTTIGFSSTTLGKAQAAGFAGASLYQNISLLAATKRTNFSNTEIIEESKNKLSLTNSQTFAIRFNSTRGDAELQDRFRYVDQLEAMSSGTSPL